MPATNTGTQPAAAVRRPREDEIDAFGVTHPGKVRKDNQDHYLVCSLRRQLLVRGSSIPGAVEMLGGPERLASIAMVADGVGGAAAGETASRVALTGIAKYVTRSLRCYYRSLDDDEEFEAALREASRECHADLQRRAEEDPEFRGMATTLTLYLSVWPRAYVLQVGDSRAYVLKQGKLIRLTRDQTMAQDMVDLGIVKPEQVAGTRLEHTLTSSIGGRHTEPRVTGFDMDWGYVVLLCSDGLTRHVSDDRIGEVLRGMRSAREACETLLEEALAGGGSDNITVVVGRAVRGEG